MIDFDEGGDRRVGWRDLTIVLASTIPQGLQEAVFPDGRPSTYSPFPNGYRFCRQTVFLEASAYETGCTLPHELLSAVGR